MLLQSEHPWEIELLQAIDRNSRLVCLYRLAVPYGSTAREFRVSSELRSGFMGSLDQAVSEKRPLQSTVLRRLERAALMLRDGLRTDYSKDGRKTFGRTLNRLSAR